MTSVDEHLVGVLKTAAKVGRFGTTSSFVDLVPCNIQGQDHFASEVLFATVKLRNSSSYENFKVVIKKQQEEAFIRDMMNSNMQFYIEVVVYNEIFPFLQPYGLLEDIFPTCIYSNATQGEDYKKDLLVLEDLCQEGYKLSDERLFLDFEHCALALKKLGRFHALSYIAKHHNSEGFFAQMEKLKEARWVSDQKEECNQFLSSSMERGIQQLLEEEGEGSVLQDIMEKTQDPHEYMKELCLPEEPTAVLCHGDFCRNNMLFKYESGMPTDIRFFDVATARYASPAIDLTFFLMMNTSAELRRLRWNELINVYYNGLCDASSVCEIPSLEAIHSEVASKAPYGYVLSSFFIPVMIDETRPGIKEIADTKTDEMDSITNRGGEQGTKLVADILRDLLKITYS